jgi:hypothetical protein
LPQINIYERSVVMLIWCVHDIIVWGICELVGVVQGYGLCEECKCLLPFKVVWVNNVTKLFKLWHGLWNPICWYMSNVVGICIGRREHEIKVLVRTRQFDPKKMPIPQITLIVLFFYATWPDLYLEGK